MEREYKYRKEELWNCKSDFREGAYSDAHAHAPTLADWTLKFDSPFVSIQCFSSHDLCPTETKGTCGRFACPFFSIPRLATHTHTHTHTSDSLAARKGNTVT